VDTERRSKREQRGLAKSAPIYYEEPTSILNAIPASNWTHPIANDRRSPSTMLKVPRILVLGLFEWHVSILASAIDADASSPWTPYYHPPRHHAPSFQPNICAPDTRVSVQGVLVHVAQNMASATLADAFLSLAAIFTIFPCLHLPQHPPQLA
ncbi:hypothetical protein VNI00_017056, partial [Paramarasmius palmivorus]